MPKQNREEYNSYMRTYILRRYHQRRAEAFRILGGKCALCGCTPKKYDFDHINPKTKGFAIGVLWSVSRVRYMEELSKCQVLCLPCHKDKTIRERGQIPARGTHGTVSAYRYCHCALCREAATEANRAWRLKKKHASVAKLGRPSPFKRDTAGSSPAGRTTHA
jgi:hypothetical protein